MNSFKPQDASEFVIDEKKVRRIAFRITFIERENAKTKSKTDKDMRKAIQSIIEEEVKKCY